MQDEYLKLLNLYENKLYCKKIPKYADLLLRPIIESILSVYAVNLFELKNEIEKLKAEIRVLKQKAHKIAE